MVGEEASSYLNEIPPYFNHEIRANCYDVIGVYVFLWKLMRFPRKKGVTASYYTTEGCRTLSDNVGTV